METTHMLQPGQPAPSSGQPDGDMQTVRPQAFRGKKHVVIYCYPRNACRLTVCMSASGSAKDGAGCPGCSMCADSIPNHFSFDNSSLHACRASATRDRAPIIPWMTLRLLGGLTPRTFLRRYWQKRPLF